MSVVRSGFIRGKKFSNTSDCERCGNSFTYEMTTKPRMACDDCRKIVAEEGKRRRSKARSERLAAERAGQVVKKKVMLIPYAGWDGSKSSWG